MMFDTRNLRPRGSTFTENPVGSYGRKYCGRCPQTASDPEGRWASNGAINDWEYERHDQEDIFKF
jgi:hypothetical protein